MRSDQDSDKQHPPADVCNLQTQGAAGQALQMQNCLLIVNESALCSLGTLERQKH